MKRTMMDAIPECLFPTRHDRLILIAMATGYPQDVYAYPVRGGADWRIWVTPASAQADGCMTVTEALQAIQDAVAPNAEKLESRYRTLIADSMAQLATDATHWRRPDEQDRLERALAVRTLFTRWPMGHLDGGAA